MKSETYSALKKDLQKLQKAIVASQIATVRRDAALSTTLQRLHVEAEVGGPFDDFVATVARKSTVLLLLRTVFVRVLEDLGILGVKRIRDEWGFAAFREVAPALGIRAYLTFVFRDLAVDFPAIFAPGEDELPLPDEDACRALWNLWHHPNKDGELYLWNGDGFDSRFLGDLYQDLDADIRKRYALRQTPRFVEEYILDHTLTPALAEFDPETLRSKGERFRLLDPTCGSGHFLIGTFHRFADYWQERHGLSVWVACERALESVWGCDINPHAVDIAGFRLLLEVVARTGVKDLERLAGMKVNLRAMDSLIPWERAAKQGELFPAKDRLDAYATPKQRRENAAFLAHAFHVVAGNPPYVQPADVGKRDDYKAFWPNSIRGKYSLSAPFVDRFFSMARHNGFVGMINSNAFATRKFGRPLIEKVLPGKTIQLVVDSQAADIPHHEGVPTLILFGLNRPPTQDDSASIIVARRARQQDRSSTRIDTVWQSICAASLVAPYQDANVERRSFASVDLRKWPWPWAPEESAELLQHIESMPGRLGDMAEYIGFNAITSATELLHLHADEARRWNIEGNLLRQFVDGSAVRDYAVLPVQLYPTPYSERLDLLELEAFPRFQQYIWPHRSWLVRRFVSGGTTMADVGLPYHAIPQFSKKKTAEGEGLVYAEVASCQHVGLIESSNLFDRTAPVIRLKGAPSRSKYLDVLAVVSSSVAEFWVRHRCHNKRKLEHRFEDYYQRAPERLGAFPLPSPDELQHAALAECLTECARVRADSMPAAVLKSDAWSLKELPSYIESARTAFLKLTNRMVALQEELDWLTYASYGLTSSAKPLEPDLVEPLAAGHRPFEIVLARNEDATRESEESAWWSRLGHNRVTEIPEWYSTQQRFRIQERIDLIDSDARLALLESPQYKRRWQLPDWEAETQNAAEAWLLDRLEDLFAPGTDIAQRGPLADPKAYRLEDIAAAWSRDPRVAAVAGVWTGTGPSVDLTLVCEKLLRANALSDNPHRVYSSEGLRKLDEWKQVWSLQDQEDSWEKAAAEAQARGEPVPKKALNDPSDPAKTLEAIPLPRKFDKTDFAKAEYFATRGKLNVLRERFILFADLTPNRFGWNGWRARERALAQVEAFTLAENDAQQPMRLPTVGEPGRCGVTYGLWESLPNVRRWGTADEHAELQALAREACRQQRCPCPIVEAWKTKVLNTKQADPLNGEGEPAKKTRATRSSDEGGGSEPTVSIAARAWVASLFQLGGDLDAAGVWSRHRSRLAEPPQGTLPGVTTGPVQLKMPEVAGGPPSEIVSLDQALVGAILDDLVASGDLQAKGRGTKKRFQLVPRGTSS